MRGFMLSLPKDVRKPPIRRGLPGDARFRTAEKQERRIPQPHLSREEAMDAVVHVLIIDDEAMIRESFRDYFEAKGYSVDVAADGREGVEFVRSRKPDIVFTDLRMPVMDGFAVIETVRQENPDMPVIVISAAGTLEDALRAVHLGAWGYVMKPVMHMEEIELEAGNALERAALIAENRSYREHLEELVQERTAELCDSEARYRTLFESANDAIILLRDERIIACNKKALDLFGCTESEALGRNLLSFSPLLQPDGAYSEEALRKYLDEALSGAPQFYDWKCSRHNGDPFDAEISLNSMELQGAVYLQAVVRDISMRKQQDALIVTLSAAVTQSANLIVIAGPDGRIVYVNPRFSEVTGLPAGQAIGQTLQILHSELNPVDTYDQLWKTISCGQVWRGELGNRKQGNGVFWLSATIAPMRDTSGAVNNFIAVMEDITSRKQYAERLYQQANYDSLTGLPNRALLAETLQGEVERMKGAQGSLCLLLMNINNFKYINDTLGHAQGDELLRQLSERLRTLVRNGDTFARFTGDAFVLVVYGQGASEEAVTLAHKIHRLLETPFHISHTELFISVSIGAVACPVDGESVENLLRNAEAAMFQAKRQNLSIQFFTSEISDKVNERLSMESRLRRALERKEFSLHFQPQVDLETGKITSVETLLRWTPPGGEMVAPSRFIPVLEETGLIVPVGEWALREACCQLRKWIDDGLVSPQVSVNISAWQFRSGRLAETVRAALEEFHLDPSCLCLELTESIVMHDMEETIRTLQTLASMGIRLSIDDFGTGYSSLSYLRRMPIHELKIDRSFVMNVPEDANSAAIVNTILSMAKSLNLEVVAEGVETEDQLRFLADRNCRKIQGYYFSKPLTREEFPLSLKKWNSAARGSASAPSAA